MRDRTAAHAGGDWRDAGGDRRDAAAAPSPEAPPSPLDRIAVVLHEPQDLVNVALLIRAMKNMGLGRLRVVRPGEPFDPRRIDGIAHGTQDVVEAAELPDGLDEALADATWVVGTSARRRAERVEWWSPEEAAERLLARAAEGDVALLFGREDRGLSNEDLDRCHAVVSVPVSPAHPSMNLAHAAVVIFYELRKAALRAGEASRRDLTSKKRRHTPPATVEDLEAFFAAWERAMREIGLFHGVDPVPKMRSFRNIFQRADLDRREVKLLQAAAYEAIHYAERERARARQEVERSGTAGD